MAELPGRGRLAGSLLILFMLNCFAIARQHEPLCGAEGVAELAAHDYGPRQSSRRY